MSNTRTNTLERNGNSNKGTNKLGSPWSRAITSHSEWNDKVNWNIVINTSGADLLWQHIFQARLLQFICCFLFNFFFSFEYLGRIPRCSLLVTTSIRHHNWHCLGNHSITRFHRNHTVSVHEEEKYAHTHTYTLLLCSSVGRYLPARLTNPNGKWWKTMEFRHDYKNHVKLALCGRSMNSRQCQQNSWHPAGIQFVYGDIFCSHLFDIECKKSRSTVDMVLGTEMRNFSISKNRTTSSSISCLNLDWTNTYMFTWPFHDFSSCRFISKTVLQRSIVVLCICIV